MMNGISTPALELTLFLRAPPSPPPHSPHPLSRSRFEPGLNRPANSQMDRRSPDERCMGRLPSKLEEVEIGWRLDALDYQGNWFPATVVDVSVVFGSHGYTLRHAFYPPSLAPFALGTDALCWPVCSFQSVTFFQAKLLRITL